MYSSYMRVFCRSCQILIFFKIVTLYSGRVCLSCQAKIGFQFLLIMSSFRINLVTCMYVWRLLHGCSYTLLLTYQEIQLLLELLY